MTERPLSEDRELLKRCGQGDREALQPLVRQYSDPARGLLVKLLGPSEDVDDVLSEVFVRLWRSAPRYRGECAPAAWIYRIAVTAATDVLRKRQYRKEAPLRDEHLEALAAPKGDDPEHLAIARDRDARYKTLVTAALERLPAEERVAVSLHYLEELPYREAAELLGCPVTTLRMRLFRGRRRMLAFLRERMGNDELQFLEPDTKPAGGFKPLADRSS